MPFTTVETVLARKRSCHPELRCCPTVTGLRRICAREEIHISRARGCGVSVYDYDGTLTLLIGSCEPRDTLPYRITRALAIHWLGGVADTQDEQDRREASAEVFCILTFRGMQWVERWSFARVIQTLAKTVHSAVACAMISATTSCWGTDSADVLLLAFR